MNLTQIIKQLWSADGPLIAAGDDVTGGVQRLCARCYEAMPHPMWKEILDLEAIEGDVREFRTWLTDTLRDFPPGPRLKMFWFGIIEDYGLDDMDAQLMDEDLEPHELEAAVEDEWLPDDEAEDENSDLFPCTAFIYLCGDRYLFTETRPVERQKGYSYDPPGQQFYPHFIEQYYQKFLGDDENMDTLATGFLLPAFAGLLISSACRSMDAPLLLGPSAQRKVVFGWDEGEPIVLGDITRAGWRPQFQPVKF